MASEFFRKGPHAAKNKISNSQDVPNADERATVIADEQLSGVDFDDKVWLYWTRNKNTIIVSVVLAFAIIIGVQSWKVWRASAKQELADAYAAAVSPAQLADFAKANAGTKLAGVALLQNADAAYADAKYAEAQALYAQAKGDLKSTILFGRALVGEAVSQYCTDAAKGTELLKAAYNTNSIDAVYKAQAGYLFGLALKAQGKTDEAKKIFAAVAENPRGGIFAQLAQRSL